jgi:hypothetical protein
MQTVVCILLVALTLVGGTASTKPDGFSAVRCGSDIPKALIGRSMSNEAVAVIEARHKDLSLKDLGGDEITDDLNSISWLICGNEYMVIEDKASVVRDVLKVPQHSKESPMFIGACRANNKELPGVIVAILKNEKGIETLSAAAAWKIDEKSARFVSVPAAGLRCPRSGIITVDGGQ